MRSRQRCHEDHPVINTVPARAAQTRPGTYAVTDCCFPGPGGSRNRRGDTVRCERARPIVSSWIADLRYCWMAVFRQWFARCAVLLVIIVLAGPAPLHSCADMIAEIYNYACVLVIKTFMAMIEFLSRVPLGQFEVGSPSILLVILWYGSLAVGTALAWDRWKAKRIDSHS